MQTQTKTLRRSMDNLHFYHRFLRRMNERKLMIPRFSLVSLLFFMTLQVSAQETYNFYFQKAPKSQNVDPQAKTDEAQPTFFFQSSEHAQSAMAQSEKKLDSTNFKRWGVAVGYSFIQGVFTASEYWDEYSGSYYGSYYEDDIGGMALTGNFYLTPLFALEYGLMSGSSMKGGQADSTLTHYGMVFQVPMESEKWRFGLTGQSLTITNSPVRNRLGAGVKIGYKLSSTTDAVLETLSFNNDQKKFYHSANCMVGFKF